MHKKDGKKSFLEIFLRRVLLMTVAKIRNGTPAAVPSKKDSGLIKYAIA